MQTKVDSDSEDDGEKNMQTKDGYCVRICVAIADIAVRII